MSMEAQPLPGKRIRVYDPPLPLEHHPSAAGGPRPDGGVAYTFIDFDAQKIDVGLDGTISLTRVEVGEERTDFQTGKPYRPVTTTVVALIDPDGHLRAETIDVALEGMGLGGRRLVQLADGSEKPNESVPDR